MKCTLSREQLLEPLTRAEKMTGKNLTLPILSCVLLRVEGAALTVTATNLEVGIRGSVHTKDTEDGVVAVSASVLTQVVNALPSGSTVKMETSDGFLLVAGAGGQAKLALQDASEYPALPKVEGGETLSLPARAVITAVNSVSYCASTSAIKPELSSVFLHANGGTLVAVATDSFRLAEKKVPLEKAVTADPILIPARSAVDLVKVLELADDTVTLSMNEHQLSITLPDVYMTLRLVNGTFPDYTQIIPKDFAVEATMLRFDLERALRRAGIFSDQFNQTTLTLEPKKKHCTIHTSHASVGETTDSIDAVLEGEPLIIRFNQRYLMDALHSIEQDSVVLQFAGAAQPAIVRPVGDMSFLYLVMPMNR